ncbi:hypothetical protein B0H13DRAFT_1935582 [Mycena leptocephala]|nr:hypothetical protein B0H13DRAFT_1935582 [Mycena leptocephala]
MVEMRADSAEGWHWNLMECLSGAKPGDLKWGDKDWSSPMKAKQRRKREREIPTRAVRPKESIGCEQNLQTLSFDRIGVDVLREPQAVLTKTKHKMKGRNVGGRVNGCGRKTKKGRRGNCRDVQSAISPLHPKGTRRWNHDAVNHHLQFGGHSQGINQFRADFNHYTQKLLIGRYRTHYLKLVGISVEDPLALSVPSFKRCTRGSSGPSPFPSTWSRLEPRYPPSSEAVPAHAVRAPGGSVPQSQFVDRYDIAINAVPVFLSLAHTRLPNSVSMIQNPRFYLFGNVTWVRLKKYNDMQPTECEKWLFLYYMGIQPIRANLQATAIHPNVDEFQPNTN